VYGPDVSVSDTDYTSFLKMIHPEDRKKIEQIGDRTLQEKAPYDIDFRIIRSDGAIRWLEAQGQAYYDGAGKFVRMIGVTKDITDRKEAERMVQESEKQYRLLFEKNPHPMWILDLETRSFVAVNEAAIRHYGYSREEFLSMTLEDIRFPKEAPVSIDNVYPVKAELGSVGGWKHQKKDGTMIDVEITSQLLPFMGRRARLVLAEDVTERKRAEEELKNSRQQLRDLSTRLQTIVEEQRMRISREVHDELGQQLTILKMELSFLKERLPENLEPLRMRTEEMSKLVDTTIQTVRKISAELRPGVLDDLGLTAAIEWQIQEFQSRTGMQCFFTSHPEEIALDPDRSTAVFRIFQETLTNIIRHAGAGVVKVRLEKIEDHLLLQVSDNGRGISEDQLANSKSLGLLGMRERALLWGGIVQICGAPEKGTTVTVKIPCHLSSGVPEPS
jgi:PAS domain S-box-containing protein